MEHGKSSFQLLNPMLNLFDPLYVRFIGCHANRDISELLRQSQLRIDRHEQHWAGMVHLFWARPVRQIDKPGQTE